MRDRRAEGKIRLGFAFGGKAAEHELSIKSALYLLAHVDRDKYLVTTLYVDEEGALAESGRAEPRLRDFLVREAGDIFGPADRVPPDFADWLASTLPPRGGGEALRLLTEGRLDLVFPVFHGQGGEDGIFQGFLETLGIPYVGCGLTGSIVGNDKACNKAICRSAGLPVADFLVYLKDEWEGGGETLLDEVEARLGYPVFVKPPCLGSSVGVSRATDRAALRAAAATALGYGSRVLLEKAVVGPEYGLGLIGNDRPEESALVEFGGCPGFLSYEAKYGPLAYEDRIPGQLEAPVEAELRAMARRIWGLLGLRGMSRLDFFVVDGRPVFIEANTVPGFGRTSVFSKMWEAAGLDLTALIDRLARYALEGRPNQGPTEGDDTAATARGAAKTGA
jgi:D-alanine-D-alanine ligase